MKLGTWVGWLLFSAAALGAQAPEVKELEFGGLIDFYYAFDFNRPEGDRAYTTQASRHNEFALNLAHVDVRLQKEKVHGRLALQAGTAVFANYGAERRYSPAGGAQLADVQRHVQEAYAGYRVGEGLWLDAGIYFSHIGAESFISKDNWTYTRSLAADYSPYYQAGVRLAYQTTSPWSGSLHLINGWQNQIENNGDKAIGLQVAYTFNDRLSVTYNNFVGREQEFRFFNDVVVRYQLQPGWDWALASDIGLQRRPDGGGSSVWFSETLLTRVRLAPQFHLGGASSILRIRTWFW